MKSERKGIRAAYCEGVCRPPLFSHSRSSAFICGLLLFLSSARAAEPLAPAELASVQAAESARIATIQKVSGAVVAVFGKNRMGGGSGVLIDPAGYALTNFHVAAACGEEGLGGLADGKLYPWKLIGFDPGGDLALIRLSGQERFPFAALGNSDRVRVGDWAMAMGNPFVLAEDYQPTVTLGIVSGVGRYQPGEGPNAHMLEYGNCIQVDSSINPGNSGGPLFNLAAQLIGINGRGSFEERGRVNVGLGYAISIEQGKNFLPDLLASKIPMHGTLEATFRDQAGQVICDQLNLDAKIASLGLELGDRLVTFDGHAITSANQFKNLICTLPADWPVEVAFEHRGQVKKVWLRLTALPYPKPADTQPATRPAAPRRVPGIPGTPGVPATRPAGTQPATQPTTRPGPRPAPPMPPMMMRPQLQGEPGRIRDPKLNREAVERILREWTEFRGGAALTKVKALVMDIELRDPDDADRKDWQPSRMRVWEALDGRYHCQLGRRDGHGGNAPGWTAIMHWDGHTGLTGPVPSTGQWKRYTGDEALRNREPGFSMMLAMMHHPQAAQEFARIELEGGDKAQNQRAYRVRAEDRVGNRFTFWFSVFDEDGRFQTRLLKMTNPALVADAYEIWWDYRDVGGIMVPFRRRYVKGLEEAPVPSEFVVTSCQALTELPVELTDAWKPPATQPATSQPATQPAK